MHYELRLLYCMIFSTSKTVKNDLNIFFRAPEDVIVCLIWTSKQGKVSSLHIKEYGSSKYLVFLVEKDWFLIIFMVSNSHSMFFGFFYILLWPHSTVVLLFHCHHTVEGFTGNDAACNPALLFAISSDRLLIAVTQLYQLNTVAADGNWTCPTPHSSKQ